MNIHLSLHTSNDTSTDRMKNKRNRLSAIRSIIANETIGNQDQMLKRLQEQGFELTQATLSRDLKQLKISKVSTDDGNYKYVLPETPRQRNSNKNLTSHTNLPRQGFLSISFSGNIAVIKTRPGYANAIAYDIASGNKDGMIYEPFVMSNLVVTPMEGFIMLEASDDMMGLSVVLGVYEDGSLHEGSMVNFAGMDLPILSGNVTYQYSEEFATDVYVARLIVDLAGQQLGLELTMYGAAAVEIEITEATASVVESTGVLEFKAAWESYPVLATVAGYQEEEGAKEYDGVQISELTIGDDDNWYDFATANVVTVTKEGKIVTLEGEYNGVSGAKYLVVITGTMDDTAVDNVITTTTAVKVIKNGQLIINKNGVEYNAQGATVK